MNIFSFRCKALCDLIRKSAIEAIYTNNPPLGFDPNILSSELTLSTLPLRVLTMNVYYSETIYYLNSCATKTPLILRRMSKGEARERGSEKNM